MPVVGGCYFLYCEICARYICDTKYSSATWLSTDPSGRKHAQCFTQLSRVCIHTGAFAMDPLGGAASTVGGAGSGVECEECSP